MKIQKFSWNIHGYNVKNKNKLYDLIRKTKPTTVVVLDNKDMASEIADLGVPYVILRVTPNDDNLHLKIRSFGEWWNIVKVNYTDKRLGVYFVNEPNSGFDRFAQMAIQGMDILASEGHWGVFGNFAVGMPALDVWTTLLKPFLQRLVLYNGWHKLGLHEGYMYYPQYAVPYLSGRHRFLYDLVGRDKLEIIFTEFGVDDIEDVRKRFPGEAIRGWKQHVDYWRSQGHPNPEQLFIDHYKYLLEECYKDDEVLGICSFGYGDSGGWDLYNFEDFPYLLDNMEQLEMETVIEVPVAKLMIRSTVDVGTRRRTGAGTNFSINGKVTTPVEVQRLNKSNGWTQYRFSDGDFWVSDAFIEEMSEGKNVTITLYNATDAEITRVKQLIGSVEELAALFEKLQAEIT